MLDAVIEMLDLTTQRFAIFYRWRVHVAISILDKGVVETFNGASSDALVVDFYFFSDKVVIIDR